VLALHHPVPELEHLEITHNRFLLHRHRGSTATASHISPRPVFVIYPVRLHESPLCLLRTRRTGTNFQGSEKHYMFQNKSLSSIRFLRLSLDISR
jgi:hypothetical protein